MSEGEINKMKAANESMKITIQLANDKLGGLEQLML
jgi:hypothetical protein